MPARAHVADDLLDQVDGAGDVGIDDAAYIGEILVEEGVAEAAAGVGEQHGDRATADRRDQPVVAFDRREVGLHRLDDRAAGAKLRRGAVALRLVCDAQQRVAGLAGDLGKREADAGRGAGDDGEAAARLI